MIESIENSIQIAVLFVCIGFSLYRALKHHSKSWLFLVFFFGSWALGDFYWMTCLIFYQTTPQISMVSDLSWFASYIFLYLLLRQIIPPEQIEKKRRLPLIGPVFTIAMAVYYMQYGAYLGNVITAGLMGLLLYAVLWRFLSGYGKGREGFLCICVLVFCLLEYGLWTSSCIFEGNTMTNPYYWIDILLTISFPFFLPAVKKAEAV